MKKMILEFPRITLIDKSWIVTIIICLLAFLALYARAPTWLRSVAQVIIVPIPISGDFDSSEPGETVRAARNHDQKESTFPIQELLHHWDRLLPLLFIGFATALGFGWTVRRNWH